MPRMTPQDLLSKIEWEGGIIEAIAYGINSTEVPESVETLWRLAEEAYDTIEPLGFQIERALEESLKSS